MNPGAPLYASNCPSSYHTLGFLTLENCCALDITWNKACSRRHPARSESTDANVIRALLIDICSAARDHSIVKGDTMSWRWLKRLCIRRCPIIVLRDLDSHLNRRGLVQTQNTHYLGPSNIGCLEYKALGKKGKILKHGGASPFVRR